MLPNFTQQPVMSYLMKALLNIAYHLLERQYAVPLTIIGYIRDASSDTSHSFLSSARGIMTHVDLCVCRHSSSLRHQNNITDKIYIKIQYSFDMNWKKLMWLITLENERETYKLEFQFVLRNLSFIIKHRI